MIICFVAPANSSHTEKWCKWFCSQGHEVHVISFVEGNVYDAKLHVVDIGIDTKGSDFHKLRYVTAGNKIKRIINDIKPDIINVHYATSYGIPMAISGLDNYILSVWGSDIFAFPRKSIFHRMILKYSLRKPRYLFSTSQAMANEAKKYIDREFVITPFGVDMELFCPKERNRQDNKFIIGTVKTLSPVYGIDYLLKAVAIFRNRFPQIDIELRIAGDGICAEEYKQLSCELGIADITRWLGYISQIQAAQEWSQMDVAIVYSLQESYGVSAIEAQACETAIIVSNIDGLKETTNPNISSCVVEGKNEKLLADAIANLYQNPSLRRKMGEEGRKYVLQNYEMDLCFRKIEMQYKKYLSMK